MTKKVGPLDLARADVERQPAVKAVALPVAEHGSDFADHPVADIGDDAGLLGDRDEGGRQPQAVARMVPAQQRLGARDFAGHQAHLRLEGEHELVALDGFGQRFLGLDLLLVLGREVGVEQAMLAAAADLARYMAMSAARISASMLVP